MLNLIENEVFIHKIEFEEGDVFIKKLTIAESNLNDAIEDDQLRMLSLFQKSICDEKGKSCYTVEELKGLDSGMAKTIFSEILDLNRPKKKVNSKKKS